jgi:hypothetical protein
MDSDPHSPVLLQHSSPPHTLSPHGNLRNSPSSFQPLTDANTIVQPQQPALPEAQASHSAMEEPPPQPDPIVGEEAERANANDSNTQVPHVQQSEGSAVAPQPSAATANSPADAPDITTESTVPFDGTIQDTASATEPSETVATAGTESHTPTTDPDPPPPQPPVIEEPKIELPEWVTYEEDKSEITEEELKNIEGTDTDISALDVQHFEQKIYIGVDDPEQRPVKKLRLSWTIKGVRGTRERPNYARVMNSPAACVDGFYWYIKFFPRGNNASHLSTYIKCTPKPPRPDSDVPENTFKVFQGPPDANLGDTEPVVELSIPATAAKNDEPNSAESQAEAEAQADSKKGADEIPMDTTTASAVESEKKEEAKSTQTHEEDWRISAEIGTVIYNPAEPRTNSMSRSEHQFNKHNDDWGWTNFHGPWNTIHVREKDQRKPLLQNDTLTIDAYIQIYDDPTQALWWHPSEESEKQWDAKSLTGYFPFGTPPLYHSPGVAGLSSLLLLKPFRDVLQDIDTGRWRKDAKAKPQPLISQLQIVLFLMRTQKKEEQYVNLNSILETLESYGENFSTVQKFWEVLRRSIELELEDEREALERLADIFDGAEVPEVSPVTLTESLKIPVEDVADVQMGVEMSLASLPGSRSFPKFLAIDLERQKFDISSREWKVLHNRVRLNDTIDLSRFSTEKIPAKYTLYGFAVHVGERVSGRAYSVLRPNGPGTKWLAFEDGDGNKIFSYTKRRIEDFEGLEGEALSSFRSTRQTAYLAMYIRTDCLKDFLPGPLEPYDKPQFDWIRANLTLQGIPFIGESKPKRSGADDNAKKNISVEIFEAAKIKGRKGLLDMHNLRDSSLSLQKLSLSPKTTYKQLRRMIAESMKIDKVETIRFWKMDYGPLGEFMLATMPRPKLEEALEGRKYKDFKPQCLWLEVLQTEEDVKLYGIADPPEPEKPKPVLDENDADLNLLFPESRDGPSEDTPAGTVSTPSSGGTDDHTEMAALPDQVQASVAAAVDATLANVPSLSSDTEPLVPTSNIGSGTSNALGNSNPDTSPFAQPTDILSASAPASASPGEATPRAAPVEHGHLVDAVTGENQQLPEEPLTTEDATVLSPEVDDGNAALIAGIIAAEIEAVDIAAEQTAQTASLETQPEPNVELVQSTGEPQAGLPDQTTADPAHLDEPAIPPPIHVYGFIQLFDVAQQDFEVHSTFFAPRLADVKETVRKALGYGDDHEFSVWQREKSCKTSTVNKGDTFETIHFRDGVDLVVGEPLSEKTKQQLLAEGKFATPASLSHYLWMKQRRHPVKAFTGTKTLSTFGRDYYSGPLLNGRFHGENGTYITSTGHTYVGPFVCGSRQGPMATLTYQNGDVYTGGFHADEKHGQGTFIQKRTGNKYVGGYQNDKRWGKGTMFYEVADEEGEMCQICYGEEMDALFYDCGHVCACVECARQVDVCPICRKSVKDVVRVFRA